MSNTAIAQTTHISQHEWLLLNHAIHVYSFTLFPRRHSTPTTCADLAATVKQTYDITQPNNREMHDVLVKFSHLPLTHAEGTSWKLALQSA